MLIFINISLFSLLLHTQTPSLITNLNVLLDSCHALMHQLEEKRTNAITDVNKYDGQIKLLKHLLEK